MSWRDRLQQASFRGVEFHVETSDIGFGRRNVLHEYPLRDNPFAEDLGRKAREYNINAYIVGADYDQQRDLLLRVIEDKDTPGTLVHPTLGSITVVPTACRANWSSQEGGIERFSLTFVEAGQRKYPEASANLQAKVLSSANLVQAASTAAYNSAFSVKALPEFVAASAQSTGALAADAIAEASQSAPVEPTAFSAFSEALGSFRTAMPTIIRTVGGFPSSFFNLTGLLYTLFPAPYNGYLAFKGLLTFGDDLQAIPGTTSTRRQQALNQTTQEALVRQSALMGMAQASSEITFVSYDDAVALRDELAEALDDEILLLGDTDNDDLLSAFEDLRATVVADITARGGSLERVRVITPPATLPALVLSYRQYGLSARAEEIIARNRIRHPGFVSGGKPLEVLV